MMVFSKLNIDAFDKVAIKVAYCKMFNHIVQDFVTRQDLSFALKASNLIVNTAVQVAVPAGTGTGTGVVSAIYDGSVQAPTTAQLIIRRKADLEAGGAAIDASVEVLSKVVGG